MTTLLHQCSVVVLDRDGVINHDSPDYILSPEQFEPIAGSLEGMRRLCEAGYRLAIATNQSAVGRGYIDLEVLEAIHAKLRQLLLPGTVVDPIVFCPHRPDEESDCRKPAPGMLLEIARRLGCRPESLLFVGDSWTDMEAARRAGAQRALVRTGNGVRHLEAGLVPEDVPVFDDLATIANVLTAGSPPAALP